MTSGKVCRIIRIKTRKDVSKALHVPKAIQDSLSDSNAAESVHPLLQNTNLWTGFSTLHPVKYPWSLFSLAFVAVTSLLGDHLSKGTESVSSSDPHNLPGNRELRQRRLEACKLPGALQRALKYESC